MKNIWIKCLACGVWLCATGAVVGQPGKPASPAPKGKIVSTPKGASRVVISVPPELKAKREKIALFNTAAKDAMEAGNYAEAEDSARQSVALGDAGLGLQYLAASLYLQSKTQQALAAYQEIIGHSGNGTEWEPYGLLLLKSGQWAQAVAAYNKALKGGGDVDLLVANNHFSPAVPEPQRLEAYLHIALGLETGWEGYSNDIRRPLQTLAEFQKALALQPNSALANYYYGYGLQDAGRDKDAKAAFDKAAALGGPDVKAAVEKALLP